MDLSRVGRMVATLSLTAFSLTAGSQERQDGPRTLSAGPLQVKVPFEPTAFPSNASNPPAYKLATPNDDEPLRLERIDAKDAHQRKVRSQSIHLTYELLLTNISSAPLTVQRVEVIDGNRRNAKPIAVYQGSTLEALLAFPERPHPNDGSNRLRLDPGEHAIVNLFLTIYDKKLVPSTLHHRVYTAEAVVEVPSIGTHHSRIPVLGPPLRGENWFVLGGPGAAGATNYHRHNSFMLNGVPEAARRYAIDWVKIEDGQMRKDKLANNASYYGYGQEVLAVADGVVANALDVMADNVPGRAPPSQPVSPDCILCGNHVVLALSPGQFATYMHLQLGSVRVMKGDRVRRGQVLGLVGNSGDSYLPHLHFHVATEPGMTGQGLPYLIERFTMFNPSGIPQPRNRELPLDGRVIAFD